MAAKPVRFLGDALKRLRSFPVPVRQDVGYQLDRLERGLQPEDFKPMPGIGPGVEEIRVWHGSGTYRVIYIARRREAIYVLHLFQKKTGRTAALDIELAKRRFASLRAEAP
jgi:phage-related protein